ncbi:MAG: GxxExxY protein [Bacteroidales bacterium]|jgi:GxxExxY protein|nr:GxxExxY protein [Bacteroidales bacterium]MDD2323577.1 GxxExxY protein [Bacteroidales bacterium]MDD3962187.1 GxxExxY protein [Bacteroidales bacterium]MDY0284723.1 GxxExxY protein [Bacteroidales bacterium]
MDLIYKQETYKIIGACMEVHKEMGYGFLEAVYHEALLLELKNQNIPFRSNAKLQISYKNNPLNKVYYADIICYDKIIIELKAMEALIPEHEAQVINYLKATGLELGLLVNFGAKSLQYKRIIQTNSR